MRKTIKKFWITALLILPVAACHKNIDIKDNPPISNNKKFYASMESMGNRNRTLLKDGNLIVWSPGEMITVFDKNDTAIPYIISESSELSTSGEFYKYDGDWAWIEEGAGLTFDKTIAISPQTYGIEMQYSSENQAFYYEWFFYEDQDWWRCYPDTDLTTSYFYQSYSYPMVAISHDDNLSFKNVNGLIKLSIKGDRILKSITLEGNSSEIISGHGIISVTSDGIPSVVLIDSSFSSSQVIQTFPWFDEQLNFDTPFEWYFSIPPTDFKKGFTVTIIDKEENKYIKKTEKQNIVRRSSILAMPTFSILDDDIIVEEAQNKEGEPAEDFDFIEGEW